MADDNYQLVRRIMLATNKIDGVYYLFSRQNHINENTLAFLYALSDGQPHSQKEVSNEWLIPRTTINSIVKTMLAEEYAAFCPQEHKKEKALVLTEKGQVYADRLFADIYTAEESAILETLRQYPPEFITALEAFSDHLYDALCRTSEPNNTQNQHQ